jgi:hypothetical protein
VVFAIMVALVSRRTRALIRRKVGSERSRRRLGGMATFGICKSTSPSPFSPPSQFLISRYLPIPGYAVLTHPSIRPLRLLPLEHRLPPMQLRDGI